MGTVNDKKNRLVIGIEVTLCLLAVAIPLAVRYRGELAWRHGVLLEAGFKLLLYAAILLIALSLNDLFHIRVLTDKRRLLPSLAKASLVAVVLYGLASAAMPDLTQGRIVFVSALVAVTLALLVQYKFFRPFLEKLVKKERVLVLGDSGIGNAIRDELLQGEYRQELIDNPEIARKTIAWIHKAGTGCATIDGEASGADEQIAQLKQEVDVVVLALENVPFPERHAVSLDNKRTRLADVSKNPKPDTQLLMRGLVALKLRGMAIAGGLDYYERLTGRVYLGEPAGPLFFSHERYTTDKLSLAIKDVWERVLAFAIFVAAIPFLILVPIAIYLDSGRPLLFIQKRVGRGGRVYNLYKWRSMTQDGEVTRVGRIIRKTKLDELPQLINVLRGQMALVGPRPELPDFVNTFAEADCYYNLRHIVKPGLTGWAQIMFPDARAEHAMTKLSYDLFYVKHLSLVSDMVIMIETFKMIVFGNRRRRARHLHPEPTGPKPSRPDSPAMPIVRARTGGG